MDTRDTLDRSNQPSARRVAVVLIAAVAALATWTLIHLLGVETTVGKDIPRMIGPLEVVVTTLGAGIAALAVRSYLERRHRAGSWPFVASTALAVSVIGPSWYADGASAVALICLHVVVAFVLLVGFSEVEAINRPPHRSSIG